MSIIAKGSVLDSPVVKSEVKSEAKFEDVFSSLYIPEEYKPSPEDVKNGGIKKGGRRIFNKVKLLKEEKIEIEKFRNFIETKNNYEFVVENYLISPSDLKDS
eukprot:Trichotokara_eunicae@DN2819_c0_g1_i2.p1